MTESALGYKFVPLGIAPRLLVNGVWYAVPMATEEPSVIGAQMFAATIIARGGGIESRGGASIGVGQIFIERCDRGQYRQIARAMPRIDAILRKECASLRARGGGARESTLCWQRVRGVRNSGKVALLEFKVDTVDAMGANRIIMLAEKIGRWLTDTWGCCILMAILSNDLRHTPSTAQFRLPISALKPLTADPTRLAEKIVVAGALANANFRRALTHNKGIMNGICALAVATGNDTRAIEAAAHGYAAAGGRYRALSRYRIRDSLLWGKITLPLAFATVGGATDTMDDTAQLSSILNIKRATELKELAAAVGLQQNFAALLALTNRGISRGHIPLQRRRRRSAAGATSSAANGNALPAGNSTLPT